MAKLGKDVDLLAFGNEIISAKLSAKALGANAALLATLDSIPRVTHIRSR